MQLALWAFQFKFNLLPYLNAFCSQIGKIELVQSGADSKTKFCKIYGKLHCYASL